MPAGDSTGRPLGEVRSDNGVQTANFADVTGTATASYTATEQGMLNANKAAINSILAALRAAKILV